MSFMNEIVYGRLERDFTLREDIDSQRAGDVSQGMLELELPLKESGKAHRIRIDIAPCHS
jgi:HSP20 family molecular chaperone IbpA